MNGRLTFANVILSGRHHFVPDCEEDWCTHCLDLSQLVRANDGSYQTVIDHHVVDTSVPEYWEWQAKCGTLDNTAVFQVLPGAELTFEDCELLDIRYSPSSFVSLSNSSLVFTSTKIKRMNAAVAFLLLEENTRNSVTLTSCYVTGLNRDYAYAPDLSLGTSFLFSMNLGRVSLIVSNSTFEDNLVYDPFYTYAFVYVELLDLQLTDSTFFRGNGGLFFMCAEAQQRHIINVTFRSMFTNGGVFYVWLMDDAYLTITMTACSFIDNHSPDPIVNGPFIQDKMLYRNNRVMGNYNLPIFEFRGFFENITNSVFDNNGAFDGTFQAYWGDFYVGQGLLNDNGLTASKAEALESSGCLATVLIFEAFCPKLINVTLVENRVPACSSSLSLSVLYPDDLGVMARLRGLWINTLVTNALSIQPKSEGAVMLENSVLEYGGRLVTLVGISPSTWLLASNVTFQYASGIKASTASVSLTMASGNFEQCKWRHNKGHDSGALAAYEGSLIVRDSQFLNNSCFFGVGDVLFAAGQDGEVFVDLSSSNFTQSQSLLGTACILVTGNLSAGVIASSTFRSSVSYSGAVLQLAHYSGQLQLTDLVMFEIASHSISLVIVTTSKSASILIERWQVFNCTYDRGLVLLAENGWPQVGCRWNEFANNNGTAVWVNAGNFSDRNSEYRTNIGPRSLYYQGGDSTGLLHSVLFSNNIPSETMGLIFLEGRNAALNLLNCSFRSNSALRAHALLELQQEADATLVNCSFQENHVLVAVIFAQFLSFTIHNSSFTNHSSVLYLEEASALIILSTISHAQAFSSLIQSSLTMRTSTIKDLAGTDNCLLSGFTSNVSLADVVIERVYCDGGVVTMIMGSRLLIERTQVRTVESGTSMLVVKAGEVVFIKTSLEQTMSLQELISLISTSLTMSETTVTNSTSSVLLASKASLSLNRCRFAHIHTTQQVGVLACSACFNLSVTACTMEDISAQSVAGIRVDTRDLQVVDSVFFSLRGADSGTLQVHADHALISACSFLANSASASNSSGGALRLNATQALITTTLFRNNSAASGGAVHWIAGNVVWQNNTLQENKAIYGPDIASFPTHLQADQDHIIVRSGYPFESALVVRLRDHFEQVVAMDDWTTA